LDRTTDITTSERTVHLLEFDVDDRNGTNQAIAGCSAERNTFGNIGEKNSVLKGHIQNAIWIQCFQASVFFFPINSSEQCFSLLLSGNSLISVSIINVK
jgi:hypothetical protein